MRHAHADWTPDEDRPLSASRREDANRGAHVLQQYPISMICSDFNVTFVQIQAKPLKTAKNINFSATDRDSQNVRINFFVPGMASPSRKDATSKVPKVDLDRYAHIQGYVPVETPYIRFRRNWFFGCFCMNWLLVAQNLRLTT